MVAAFFRWIQAVSRYANRPYGVDGFVQTGDTVIQRAEKSGA